MKSEKCSLCGEESVRLTRLGTCSKCYHAEYRHIWGERGARSYVAEHFESEKQFSKLHPRMIYHPANFYFDGLKYSPDFYDPRKNVFYEVVGTRQAFHRLKGKIEQMKIFFPKISLSVVWPDGRKFKTGAMIREERQILREEDSGGSKEEMNMAWIFKGELVRKHRDDNGLTRSEYCKICGFSRQTLFEIERNGRKPTISFLEKVTDKFNINPLIFFVKEKQTSK